MRDALRSQCFYVFRAFYTWNGNQHRFTYFIWTIAKLQYLPESTINSSMAKPLGRYIFLINGFFGDRFIVCLLLIDLLLLERLVQKWRTSTIWFFSQSKQSQKISSWLRLNFLPNLNQLCRSILLGILWQLCSHNSFYTWSTDWTLCFCLHV